MTTTSHFPSEIEKRDYVIASQQKLLADRENKLFGLELELSLEKGVIAEQRKQISRLRSDRQRLAISLIVLLALIFLRTI
jgi:hypothetical protein